LVRRLGHYGWRAREREAVQLKRLIADAAAGGFKLPPE
jgi:hypothetical protein